MIIDPESNVYVNGRWYGPSYPDAVDPPVSTGREDQADTGGGTPNDSGAVPPIPGARPGTVTIKGRWAASPPPLAGPGSARSKWAAYATDSGVQVGGEMTRDEIVAACRAAGVRVE